MHARLTTVQYQPGKIDDGVRVIRDSISPAARQQQGCTHLFGLIDRASGKGIAISLWETEADLRASETTGYYQQQVAKITPLLAAPPVRETCEVAVYEPLMPKSGAAPIARLLTGQYQLNKIDEAIRTVRDSIFPDVRQQKGFTGALLLVDRASGKGIGISLWETMAALTASEASGNLARNLTKVVPFAVAPPVREAYELPIVDQYKPMTMPPMGAQPQPPAP
ncbi:MAG: hypothetical protein OJF49_002751 [Ktedonobacterales bacterium]|jgi:quinol monooxygenase YgiN|nr:MAG: hypothetical protein OJF49_002751 [Ktedonobacterales bacterium]